jgi:anti-anti-sigma factor
MQRKKLEARGRAHDERTWIYTLTGSLYGSPEAYEFQNEVRERIGSGTERLVIDLSGVDKIDSCGIGVLVATMWSASQAGIGLVLAALTPKVERLLSMAMLLEHIDHAQTLDEALAKANRMKAR